MPLWDRPALLAAGAFDEYRAQARWKRWSIVLNGEEALEKRLRAAGSSPASIPGLLGASWPGIRQQLPRWARTLDQVRRVSHEISSATSDILEDRCLDTARPVPFQEVLIPFVAYGRKSFAQKSGTAKTVLGDAALNALERQLLTHLSFIANLAIGREFYEFRFRSAPAAVFESLWDRKTPGRTIYAEFVRSMRHGGFDAFFEKYPVLARLCCQSVDQWTDAAVNLCRRFLGDFAELRN